MAGGQEAAGQAEKLPVEGEMPPLDGAVAWLNSPTLTTGALEVKSCSSIS
jgi:hypothetical protein